jgi:Malectin domain/Fibronectin type III domain
MVMCRRMGWVLILLGFARFAAGASVMLQWDPSSGATGYRIYYGLAGGSYPTVVETGAAPSSSISGLTEGTRYFFAATAFNAHGESDFSNEVNTVAGPPQGPTVIAINAGGPAYTAAIASTIDDALYQSKRYGNVTYTIPVPNGTYQVTLKFAEIWWSARWQRLFDVLLEGVQVIANLDLYRQVRKNRTYDRTFTTQVTDGHLTIQFRTDQDNATIAEGCISEDGRDQTG